MMSEKRFTYDFEDCDGHKIIDFQNDFKAYPLETVGDFEELVALLNSLSDENEQLRQQNKELQDKIDWLCEQTGYDGAKFRHIEELKGKLREKEEDEQLYAQEIVKLKKELQEKEETLEQSIRFKALGGNY